MTLRFLSRCHHDVPEKGRTERRGDRVELGVTMSIFSNGIEGPQGRTVSFLFMDVS